QRVDTITKFLEHANKKGDSFVNPFMKEVWDYDITVAKAAAKAGFQDIQFDYVRFPEGFENEADSLTYSKGDYKNSKLSSGDQRVDTITKFLEHANKKGDSFVNPFMKEVWDYD
ncbi:hypothetical protein EF900_19520, partial [Staphylococcus aureus]